MGGAAAVRKEIRKLGDPERARLLQGFFKTGSGEYGEGDVFLGLRVPQVRALVKRHRSLPFRSIEALLRSRYHEERLFALLVMVERYRREEEERERTYRLYLENTDRGTSSVPTSSAGTGHPSTALPALPLSGSGASPSSPPFTSSIRENSGTASPWPSFFSATGRT